MPIPDTAQVNVDAAVVTGQRAAQRLLREFLFAYDPAGLAHQHFQQIELGTGEFKRFALPLQGPPFRP
jgi:hypothetical protein